jgi:hypothetical protein
VVVKRKKRETNKLRFGVELTKREKGERQGKASENIKARKARGGWREERREERGEWRKGERRAEERREEEAP